MGKKLKTFTRRGTKFLHTVTGLGLVGGLAAYMMVLWAGPDVTSVAEYAALRESLAVVSKWLIMPSMLGVILSGLLAMALNFSYMESPWVWLKLLSGVLVFEGSLGSIDGPAQAAAELSRRVLAGEAEASALAEGVKDAWVGWWTLLGLAVANIALATWRPKFRFGAPPYRPKTAGGDRIDRDGGSGSGTESAG